MHPAVTAPLFGVPIYTVPVERGPIPVGDARSPGFSSSSRHDGSRAAWPTGDPLDLSINGPGYFRVASHDGAAFGEVLYTRSGDFGRDTGDFGRDADGYVVDGSGRYLIGYALGADGKPTDTETRIQVPSEAVSVSVGADGIVVATDASAVPRSIGAISLAGFPKPASLAGAGGGAFRSTAASGSAITGTPGTNGLGTIASARLESASVGLDRLLADTFSGRHGVAGSHRLAQAVTEAYSGLAQLGRRGVLA